MTLILTIFLFDGCGKKSKKEAASEAPEDSVELTLAIPLTPEQATAMAGITDTDDITETDDLVMDFFANARSSPKLAWRRPGRGTRRGPGGRQSRGTRDRKSNRQPIHPPPGRR